MERPRLRAHLIISWASCLVLCAGVVGLEVTVSSPSFIIYQGGSVQGSITVLAFSGPVRVLHPSCPTPAPCDPTVFYVRVPRGGIVPVPDGTPARPFASIADALQRAEDDGLCGVEVQVANGRYDEDLVITRPTAIVGESQVGVRLPIAVLNTVAGEEAAETPIAGQAWLRAFARATPRAIVAAPCTRS